MIERQIEKSISDAVKSFDCVTILGPRQSGKTTVVKKLFPNYFYVNFENQENILIYKEDPKSLFVNYKNIIIDEVQKFPEILSWVQIYVDTGLYKIIITGSNQLDLRSGVTQSLAGRTAIFKLLPFSIPEIQKYNLPSTIDAHMFKGSFPAIYDKNHMPYLAYRSYYETYLQRDIQPVLNVSSMYLYDRFVRMCAARVGRIVNFSQIGNDLGLSVNTIKSWLSILDYTFNCYLLQPFYGNFEKRLVKSPKIYFYDTGLVCYLLGIENENQLSTHPLRGEIFENFVINDFVKKRFNEGRDFNGYFFRDSNNLEVDYLSQTASGIDAYEIKSSFTYNNSFHKSMEKVEKIEGMNIISKNIIYNGETQMGPHNIKIHNVFDFFK